MIQLKTKLVTFLMRLRKNMIMNYYDSDGNATSFSYNGTMYFYVKNLQGDVVRIIDLSSTEVASYVYDS